MARRRNNTETVEEPLPEHPAVEAEAAESVEATSESIEATAEVEAPEATTDVKEEPLAEEHPAVESQPAVDPPTASSVGVYSVQIPRCLLGQKFVFAENDVEALDKYKRSCGINRHAEPAKVRLTELDPGNLPEGVELFGD